MEGKDFFKHIRSSKGDYDVRAHLAEMIALLGPPPKELLDREKLWSDIKWGNAVLNSDDKLCQTAREYFGGPFFNSDGKPPRRCQVNMLYLRTEQGANSFLSGEFMHKDLIPTDVSLEGSVLSLEGDDKRLFLNFARKMLQWLPEHRKTAKELLEDPWLAL